MRKPTVYVQHRPATGIGVPPFVLISTETGGMMHRPGTGTIPSFNTRDEAKSFAAEQGWKVVTVSEQGS